MGRHRSRVLTVVLAALLAALVGQTALTEASADTTNPPPSPAGLVGRWHLDTIAGDTTPDDSGFGRTAVVDHMVTVQGLWGNAVSNDLGKAVVGGPVTGTSGATVMAWVKVSGFAPAAGRYVVAQGAFGCTQPSWGIVTGAGGALSFSVSNGTQAWTTPAGPTAVWDGGWHAVAGVYDGTSVALYVDGQPVGTPVPAGQMAQAPLSDLVIGNYPDAACTQRDIQALLDEVHVYDRGLSAAEVVAMQTGQPLPSPSPSPPPSPTPAPKPAPVAAFTAVGKPSSLKLVLDAGLSAGVDRFAWDLNGDGTDDLSCGADQPVLGARLLTGGTTKVRLSAVGADGQVASVTQALTLGGPKLTAKTVAKTPQVGMCGKSAASVFGAIGDLCQPQSMVFGAVEVQGCLTKLTRPGQLPQPDQGIVDELRAKLQKSPQLQEYVFKVCKSLALSGASQDCRSTTTTQEVRATDILVSFSPVMVNGMTLRPLGDRALVLAPQVGYIGSSSAELRLGSIRLFKGAPAIDVNTAKQSSSIFPPPATKELSLDLGSLGLSGLPDIGGLTAFGSTSVLWKRSGLTGSTRVSAHLRLPEAFAFLGAAPSGDTVLYADNRTPFTLDSIDLRVPSADLGAARLENLRLVYARTGNVAANCGRDYWGGFGSLVVGEGSGAGARIDMQPPIPYGFGLCDGGFAHGGAKAEFFGSTRPQLFPGVFLERVGLGLQARPPALDGEARLSVAELVKVDGGVLMALASAAEPYELTQAKAQQLGMPASQARTLRSLTVAAGGTVAIDVGPFDLPVGGAYALVNDEGVRMGGEVSIVDIKLVYLRGRLNGAVAIPSGKFDINGQVVAGIDGIGEVGAKASVTSIGFVVCANVLGVNPGAGYRWGDALPEIFFPDCKPSTYWLPAGVVPTLQRVAADSLAFDFDGTDKGIRLVGAGAAPQVRLVAPDGTSVDTATQDFVSEGGLAILRQPAGGTTYVGVTDGPKGTYRVELLPGSAAVSSTAETGDPRRARIDARVSGHGQRRTLTYTVRDVPRRTVRFYSVGRDSYELLGRARTGTHRLRFTVRGGSGPRRIVAEATIGGLARPAQTVARYRVHVPKRLAAPQQVRVRRHGRAVEVRWQKVAWAEGYDVAVLTRSGVRLLRHVERPRAVIRGLARWQRGSVKVVALRDGAGRPAVVRLRGRGEAPTRFSSYADLGRG